MTAPAAAVPAPNAPTQTTNIAKPVVPTNGAKAPEATVEDLHEIQVDSGTTRKVTLAELKKMALKSGYADKVTQQAKEALRAAKELKAQLAEKDSVWDDDARLEAELEKRGKLDALARKRLAEKLREQEMTPEQREAEDRRRENEDLKKKLQAVEEEKKQARLSENAKRIQSQIESELDAAWKRAEFERGPDAFYAVYEVFKEFVGLGLLDPSQPFTPAMAERIIETARENIDGTDKRREQAVLKGLKGAALVNRLGKSVVDEVLRYKVEELRGGGAKKPNGVTPAPSKTEPQTFISPQEALKKMRGA